MTPVRSAELPPVPVLEGDCVRLRPVRPSDKRDVHARARWTAYHRWVQPDALSPLRTATQETNRWYSLLAYVDYAWAIEVDRRCIGSAFLRSSRAPEDLFEYSIGIVDPTMWNQGYGTEATRLMLRCAFGRLRQLAVLLSVLASNRPAIACYTKCGFLPVAMTRRGRFNQLGMVCLSPRLGSVSPPPPRLVLTPERSHPLPRHLPLRKAEAAFLGVAPCARVAWEITEEGALIIQPAEGAGR